jgi:hypothetical protein
VSGGSRLERLLAIRRLAEELDRRDLAVASAAVAEVRMAIAAQAESRVEAERAARAALACGDRREGLLAEAQGEVAGWNQARLGPLLRTREAEVVPAMNRFRESRREHEQLKLLVDAADQARRIDEDRRAQAAADDWFLSRRARRNIRGYK